MNINAEKIKAAFKLLNVFENFEDENYCRFTPGMSWKTVENPVGEFAKVIFTDVTLPG